MRACGRRSAWGEQQLASPSLRSARTRRTAATTCRRRPARAGPRRRCPRRRSWPRAFEQVRRQRGRWCTRGRAEVRGEERRRPARRHGACRARAAQRVGDGIRLDRAASQEARTVQELDERAARPAVTAPQPSASKPAAETLSPRPARPRESRRRTRRPRGTGVAGGGERTLTGGVPQVIREERMGAPASARPSCVRGLGLRLPLPNSESWACCSEQAGVLRDGPRPYREWDSRPGGVRLNMYGRLAYRLGPVPRLPPLVVSRGGVRHGPRARAAGRRPPAPALR